MVAGAHEDVAAVAYDTEHFTSRSVIVSELRPDENELPAPIGIAPPITSDPPFHAVARRMLLPAFGPKAVAEYEQFTRELCRELLDATAGKDEIDAAVDYAQHIPVRVIVKMLGFPQEDADIFRRVHPPRDRGRGRECRGAAGAVRRERDRRVPRRADRGAPRRAAATTSRRSCSKPSSTATSSIPTTSAAR